MSIKNTEIAYGTVAKLFHWTIAILLVFMLIFGFFLEDVPKDYQPVTYNLHKVTGLMILLLMLMRLVWALINVKPLLPKETPRWQRMAERLVHSLLYLSVICMPLLGWVGSVAGGRPPKVGDFQFVLPVEANKEVASKAFDFHNQVAIILIVLVSIHVLAALYHQFVKKDNVLSRMW